MDGHRENASGVWTTPECPFRIEYVPRVLDDIRLAVTDAFFSLPRGGAEIGGILLGSHSGGLVTITGYQALDCEHAFGPGFTLSPRDKAALAALLAEERPAELGPVGWYHSHTRSEIFLSEADLQIHNAYFPELWQVALVVKPHTFQPARAGFFFRGGDGKIHQSASYHEFEMEPQAVRPAPGGAAVVEAPGPAPESRPAAAKAVPDQPATESAAAAEPVAPQAAEPVTAQPAAKPEVALDGKAARAEIRLEPAPAPPAAAAPEPPAEPAQAFEVPGFATKHAKPSQTGLKILTAVAAALVIASATLIVRQAWLGRMLKGSVGPAKIAVATPARAAPSVGLNLVDDHGQLQIRWDHDAAAVRSGSSALLEILDDGATPRAVPLDSAHLESGSFTYARQGGKVEVVMVIDPASPRGARESSTFVGKPPVAVEDEEAVRKQREDLTQQNAKLQSELRMANERIRVLQKSLADERELLRVRERLTNQIPK